jgi:hypothetical protein
MSSTKGMYLPLSIVQGESLDVMFDVSLEGVVIDPYTVTFMGAFRISLDDSPIPFTFISDPINPNIIHATYPYTDSDNLVPENYKFEIRMLCDNKVKTILYGPLDVLPKIV